jgi:dienelactone hydrolase
MRTGWLGSLLCAATLAAQPVLEGTKPLTRQGDLAMEMVASIDRYLMQRLAGSPQYRRAPRPEDRDELRRLIGVVDPRVMFDSPTLLATLTQDAKIAGAGEYEVFAVRWPVLDGMDAEGLLVRPKGPVRRYTVVVPDAEAPPERYLNYGAYLATAGTLVLIPTLIDRSDTYSGSATINRWTNQPHREFIYRMAFDMGRHIIGYEVQKVLAAVDWFSKQEPRQLIGVHGDGEGGLLALYAGAIDERIGETIVAGYFGPREAVWQEPIYRNIWSQLNKFGDAELAGLIAPRGLTIQTSRYPEVSGPPAEKQGRRGAAPGRIATPPAARIQAEVDRAKQYHPNIRVRRDDFQLAPSDPPALLQQRDPQARQKRAFDQMVEFTQRLVRLGEFRRREFFSKLDTSSPEALDRSGEPYRKHLWEEILGRMPPPTETLEAQTRLLYDKPGFRGYEVLLPVWGEVYAYGILLLPKDLKPGERRPVVVAQHGLDGRPQWLIDPPDQRNAQIYLRYAATLAERGFIVYAPQNPYIGGEQFRVLLRKANPLKLSLFSFIIGQHDRTLEWLARLPNADPARIGFYGLSYGGKTAMRVPSLLKRYALSICSADFNEWIGKITTVDQPFSYMFTQEYDMLEWNLGNTFNYAEMTALIAPRPFMVERGHKDGVGIDEWVASEYAKVRRFYTYLGLANKTEIEFFDGPHSIHGVATYDFLHRHLNWPKR